MSLNMKVVAGLAAVGLAVYLVAPNVAYAALPLLILAACPLSMVIMMKMMSGGKEQPEEPAEPVTSGSAPHNSDELAGLRTDVDRLRAQRSDAARNGSTDVDADNSSRR